MIVKSEFNSNISENYINQEKLELELINNIKQHSKAQIFLMQMNKFMEDEGTAKQVRPN